MICTTTMSSKPETRTVATFAYSHYAKHHTTTISRSLVPSSSSFGYVANGMLVGRIMFLGTNASNEMSISLDSRDSCTVSSPLRGNNDRVKTAMEAKEALGNADPRTKHTRVHTRMVIQAIGQPLRAFRATVELIVAVYLVLKGESTSSKSARYHMHVLSVN